MKRRYHSICIDANNLFWRAFCVNTKNALVKKSDVKFHIYIGAIELALKRIKEIIKTYAYKDTIIYFLFDNPESKINIRKILSEGEYKHPRSEKRVTRQFYNTINIFVEVLKCYSDNFRIVAIDQLEADDLTYPLVQKIKPAEDNFVLFISADMDWSRNIDDYCHWFNWVTIYDIKEFKQKYGFSPVGNAVQLYKAIHGDNVDNIKNVVPYLPKEILLDIVTRFTSIDDLFSNLWKQDYPKKWKIKIKEVEREIKINYQLADFLIVDGDIEEYIINSKEDLKILKFWYDLLEIPDDSRMLTERKDFFTRKKISRI